MQVLLKIFLILFCLVLGGEVTVQAQTAAVLINMTCNEPSVSEEFRNWRNNSTFQDLFSPILILDDTPETKPTKENILQTIRFVYEQRPSSVFFLIYGIETPERILVSNDYKEMTQELFVVNENYIANEIVIMDINKSFRRFNYQLPDNPECNIVRAELQNNLNDLSSLRQRLMTNNRPFSISQLRQVSYVTISPMLRPRFYDRATLSPIQSSQEGETNVNNQDSQTAISNTQMQTISDDSSFRMNPVSGKSLVYYLKAIKGRPKRETHILQVISNNEFKNIERISYPYNFDNLISKDIHSNFLYVLSPSNGNHLDVFHKRKGTLVFQAPLYKLPKYQELMVHSTEFTSPQTTIFAFNMPDYKVGLWVKQKDTMYFSELNCMGHNIETMTVASRSSNLQHDGLVYIHDQSLKFHPISQDATQSVANDDKWYTDDRFSRTNMSGAKIIWWPPNAFILAKNLGLYWMGGDEFKELKELYKKNEKITDYHVDTFYSGDGKRLGFVWSCIDIKGNLTVWLGLQQKDQTIVTHDITSHVLKQMNLSNKEKKLPLLYLKDRSLSFDQLYGALIFNTQNDQCNDHKNEAYIVKYIYINISKVNIRISQKWEKKECGLINDKDIKVLSQYQDKLIIHINFKRNSDTKEFEPYFLPLFTFPSDPLDF